MKLERANTRVGVTFPIANLEDSDVLLAIQEPAKLTRITDVLNMYLGNKTVSVEASSDLADKIESAGFKRETETTIKDGESVELPTERHSTLGKFIQSALDALVAGTWRPEGFTLPSGDDKQKEKGALAFLQTYADACGNSSLDGKGCYLPTLEKTTRTGSGGLIPKWAMDGARQIIANGSQAKWAEKFTNGYTSGSGVAIDPIAFEDFQVVPDANASATNKQAVLDTNVKRLAKCLVEQRSQENAKRAQEFA
jgi:hypothetical protein